MASQGAKSLEGLNAVCRSRTTWAEVREEGLSIAGEGCQWGREVQESVKARRRGVGAWEGSYLMSSPDSPNTPSTALAWDMMERRKSGGALIWVVRRQLNYSWKIMGLSATQVYMWQGVSVMY